MKSNLNILTSSLLACNSYEAALKVARAAGFRTVDKALVAIESRTSMGWVNDQGLNLLIIGQFDR